MRDAMFLQRYFRPGDKVLIKSFTSGLYHALTRTTSPLSIPGDSELIFRSDFGRQTDYLNALPDPAVIDVTTINQRFLEIFLRRYPSSLRNPEGNLIILRRSQ